MTEKHYQFFQNRECEYFPCHSGVPEAEFNCLFCYCPLYFLNRACGGSCAFTQSGIKDCTGCTVPHQKNSYEIINMKLTAAIKKGGSNG